MSKISEAANRSFNTILTAKQVFERFGGAITINGLGYSVLKGEKKPVLYFAEGAAVWATNTATAKFVGELLRAYDDDLVNINEDFRYHGVKIQIGPLADLGNGKTFWPVTKIADVDFEPDENADESDESDAPDEVQSPPRDEEFVPF